ncbi:hypothetical protein ACVWW1_008812 [Bradyrhizobium sp. JR3.5]
MPRCSNFGRLAAISCKIVKWRSAGDSNLGLCFVSASCRSKICARRYAYPAQPPERARFDALFEIERAINGRGADERRAVRQEKSKPLLKDIARLVAA